MGWGEKSETRPERVRLQDHHLCREGRLRGGKAKRSGVLEGKLIKKG